MNHLDRLALAAPSKVCLDDWSVLFQHWREKLLLIVSLQVGQSSLLRIVLFVVRLKKVGSIPEDVCLLRLSLGYWQVSDVIVLKGPRLNLVIGSVSLLIFRLLERHLL